MSQSFHPEGGIYEVVLIYYQIGIICEVCIYHQIWNDMQSIADIPKLGEIRAIMS